MQSGPGNRISHLAVISRTLLIALLTLFSSVGYTTEEVQQAGGTEAVQPSQEVANHPGGMIDVMLPLVGDADNRTKRKIRELLDRIGPTPERPIVVLRLSVGDTKFGLGSDFFRARALAEFLTSPELARARTVAYVPESIKGHAVLVALACEQIVMAPEAEIGEVGADIDGAPTPGMLAEYAEITRRRKTIPEPLVMAMLDKSMKVFKAETEVSVDYVRESDLQEFEQLHTLVAPATVLIDKGQWALFSGRQARQLGFVGYLAKSPEELRRALDLPASALEQDPSLDGGWRPIQVRVQGVVGAETASQIIQMISRQIDSASVNFVCVWLDSPGGNPQQSLQLATFLADLDSADVRTVAYIPGEARGDAALIALGCDQIVMHPESILGGSGAFAMDEEETKLIVQTIRTELAPKTGRSWSLGAAIFATNLDVYAYQRKGSGLTDYFCEEELKALADPEGWQRGERVATPGRPLRLEGDRAHELGLCRFVVGNFREFREAYGLENDPALVEPSWADKLIRAMASPGVAVLLFVIGGGAMYAEVHAPGIGIGGFIGLLCFTLFFWSRYLEGTAMWLEALLFAIGIVCLLFEIFILPGFGVFGLGGGVLILASLILASQTFIIPHNEYQIEQLSDSLLSLVIGATGTLGAAYLVGKYLPHTPIAGLMFLTPPKGKAAQQLAQRESLVHFEHLVGVRGVATTQLTPSGKGRFGDEIIDVIAMDMVDQGTPLVVTKVRGNRVEVCAEESES